MSQAQQKVAQTVSEAQLARLVQMTGFEQMAMLNNLAGNLATGHWDDARAQFKIIKSEVKELVDGVAARDIHELRDGIADVQVTVLGLGHRMCLDPREVNEIGFFDPSNVTGWDAADTSVADISTGLSMLEQAIDAEDLTALDNAFYALQVSTLGLAFHCGIPAKADLDEVVFSNLTKFDPSGTDDVRATVAKYLAIGVETVQLERDDPLCEEGSDRKLYVTKSAYDQSGTDNKQYPKGKWLKSANFVEPEFAPLSLDTQEQFGLIKVRRDMGGNVYGVYVGPVHGGYLVRAIDAFEAKNSDGELATVKKDELFFISDVDHEKSLQEVPVLTASQVSALVDQLDAVPEVTAAQGLYQFVARGCYDAGEAPNVVYTDVSGTRSTGDLYKDLAAAIGIDVHDLDPQEIICVVSEWVASMGYRLHVAAMGPEIGSGPVDQVWFDRLLSQWVEELSVARVFCTDSSLDTALPGKLASANAPIEQDDAMQYVAVEGNPRDGFELPGTPVVATIDGVELVVGDSVSIPLSEILPSIQAQDEQRLREFYAFVKDLPNHTNLPAVKLNQILCVKYISQELTLTDIVLKLAELAGIEVKDLPWDVLARKVHNRLTPPGFEVVLSRMGEEAFVSQEVFERFARIDRSERVLYAAFPDTLRLQPILPSTEVIPA